MTSRKILTNREIYEQLCRNIDGLQELEIQRLRLHLHAKEYVRLEIQEPDGPEGQGEWRSFYIKEQTTGTLQSAAGRPEVDTFIQELLENFPVLRENNIANMSLTLDMGAGNSPPLCHIEMDVYPSLPASARLLKGAYILADQRAGQGKNSPALLR